MKKVKQLLKKFGINDSEFESINESDLKENDEN